MQKGQTMWDDLKERDLNLRNSLYLSLYRASIFCGEINNIHIPENLPSGCSVISYQDLPQKEFDILGSIINDIHSSNKDSILFKLSKFHLEISGINFKILHLLNISFILVTLFVFQLEISGKDNNDVHSLNI